jgi:hypothetical protein
MIENDMLIRETPVYERDDCVAFRKDCVITKEEFLTCYNVWILGENLPNCDGDMRGDKE